MKQYKIHVMNKQSNQEFQNLEMGNWSPEENWSVVSFQEDVNKITLLLVREKESSNVLVENYFIRSLEEIKNDVKKELIAHGDDE